MRTSPFMRRTYLNTDAEWANSFISLLMRCHFILGVFRVEFAWSPCGTVQGHVYETNWEPGNKETTGLFPSMWPCDKLVTWPGCHGCNPSLARRELGWVPSPAHRPGEAAIDLEIDHTSPTVLLCLHILSTRLVVDDIMLRLLRLATGWQHVHTVHCVGWCATLPWRTHSNNVTNVLMDGPLRWAIRLFEIKKP